MNSLIKRTAKLTKVSEWALYQLTSEKGIAARVSLKNRLAEQALTCTCGKGHCRQADAPLRRVQQATIYIHSNVAYRTLKKFGFQYKKWSLNALLVKATHIVQSVSATCARLRSCDVKVGIFFQQ